MTLQRDPERNELRYLHKFADFTEQACAGDWLRGRADDLAVCQGTQPTIGIDPDTDALRIASVDRPSELEDKVLFACAASEYLPFSKETFDIAVLAWSL